MPPPSRTSHGTLVRVALVAAAVILVAPARPAAHDIPADVLVRAFVKPEGSTLRLLLRVPLGAMRDVEFPIDARGFLTLPLPEHLLSDAATTWLVDAIDVYEGDRLLSGRLVATTVSLPSDRSFATYSQALQRATGPPLPETAELSWNVALLDVLVEYPIASEHDRFSVQPMFARLGLRVATVLRFLPPGSVERAFEYPGDPGLVRLDPSWHQAAARFVVLGFRHILEGTDHLLFLCCLVIPFRRWRPLVLIITSFTVAHSITLAVSALDLGPRALWFPPFIETVIAASIVYMAFENIVMAADGRGGAWSLTRRWTITFLFGLAHGFGFAFALKETLQFAGSHLVTSLFSFNLGIELGQIVAVSVLVPVLSVLFRYVMSERTGIILLSALIAHTAWHWLIERFDRLRQFQGPSFDATDLSTILEWAFAFVAIGAAIWVARMVQRRVKRAGLQPDSKAS
jgi:hypothetical protein